MGRYKQQVKAVAVMEWWQDQAKHLGFVCKVLRFWFGLSREEAEVLLLRIFRIRSEKHSETTCERLGSCHSSGVEQMDSQAFSVCISSLIQDVKLLWCSFLHSGWLDSLPMASLLATLCGTSLLSTFWQEISFLQFLTCSSSIRH